MGIRLALIWLREEGSTPYHSLYERLYEWYGSVTLSSKSLGAGQRSNMELHDGPIKHIESKFVITEERAYFVPYLSKEYAPKMIEILGEIFDLDDSEIYREVDGKLFGGRIVLGYFDPSNKEIIIHTPL